MATRKTKEFKSLSEFKRGCEASSGWYPGDRVKEFVKFCLADGWDKQFENQNEDFKAGVQFMKEKIIKNAGEKLT